MKIRKDLLAIKSHYFLRYAGASPLLMLLPLITRSKGLSAQMVGVLWTVLTAVGLITNSIAGTLADYFRAHRIVFVSCLISLTTGIVSMYWIPKLPDAAHSMGTAQSLKENTTLGFSAFNTSLALGVAKVGAEMVVEESQQTPPVNSSMEKVERDAENMTNVFQYPQFWMIFFALMADQIGLNIEAMISDAVCFKILGSERHKYGRQRLWGTIGMGLVAVVSGALVDIYSKGLPEKDYLPAIIICLVMMAADIAVVACIRIPYAEGEKLIIGDVGSTILNPKILLFLVTVYVMGVSLGILWVFKLMMVEDVALAWNPDFQVLKLLQGLVLGIENFLGEVPFFFLSGMIIERLGFTPVLTTSLATLGLQCCLYYTVTNPWWFLPIEVLNGPSYGLFHSAMASYTSHIAPQGAQATLQSIVRTAFSTGLCTAGFLGGMLYNAVGGSVAFLLMGVFDLAYVLVFGLLHFLVTRFCTKDKTARESSFTAVQCKEKIEILDNNPEVVKELLPEKGCSGPVDGVAKPYEGKDVCENFLV